MTNSNATTSQRRATSIEINADLLDAAQSHDVDLAKLVENALAIHLQHLEDKQRQQENAAAIEAYNEWVDQRGDILAAMRREVWLGEVPSDIEGNLIGEQKFDNALLETKV